MKKKIFLTSLFCALLFQGISQKNVFYIFDTTVNNSLKNGIKYFSEKLKKPENELMLYAMVIIKTGDEFDIWLQSYTRSFPAGVLSTIKTTNRKIKLGSVKIPIVFLEDIFSSNVQKDKIQSIPLSGYHIKIVYENHQQKVLDEGINF